MVYKYEQEVEKRIQDLDWAAEFKAAKELGLNDEEAAKFIRTEFLMGASNNLRTCFDYHYRITENGVVRITEHKDPQDYLKPVEKKTEVFGLPFMEMPCITSDGGDGLYFVGMIGMSPEGTPYYLAKVGMSKDIKKRIAGYASMNPMIYHNNMYITDYDRSIDGEHNCHAYIASRAYAVAQNTEEWFYVDEATYFDLCDIFANKEMFKAIAEGRD